MAVNNAINATVTGNLVYDGTSDYAGRSYVSTKNSISITNADGTAGNPKITLDSWDIVESQTASSDASLIFKDLPSSSFTTYVIIGKFILSDSANDHLLIQFSDDNGDTFATTGYTAGVNGSDYDATTLFNYNSTTGIMVTPALATASNFQNFICYMYMIDANGTYCNGLWSGYDNTQAEQGSGYSGGYSGLATSNALRLIMATGNIAVGDFTLYHLDQ